MVKSIFLQDGEEIFVDDEDYERVNQYKWWKSFQGNTRRIATVSENGDITLVNFLIGKGCQKERNNLFTRDNLVKQGNSFRYRMAKSSSKSKYKGLGWSKSLQKWKVNISVDNKKIDLGYFENEDEAARKYNEAVMKYFNGAGYINIIGKDNRTPKNNYSTSKYYCKNRKKYKGLTKINNNKIRASICYKKRQMYIGSFKNEQQAALAYNLCSNYLMSEKGYKNNVPITDELKEFISNWEIPEKIKALKQ